MRLLLQRVKQAAVTVEAQTIGSIGSGLLVLLGIHKTDKEAVIAPLVTKLVHLRIFKDEQDKMNRSVLEIGGGILVVSQFTLYANCKSGRRPDFLESAPAVQAEPLYQTFLYTLKNYPIVVEAGRFGANMDVSSINAGPVTLLLDSDSL